MEPNFTKQTTNESKQPVVFGISGPDESLVFHFPGLVVKMATDPNAPGEMGRPHSVQVATLNATEKAIYDRGWARHGFNQYISDVISIQRTLKDVRDKECFNLTYNIEQPMDTSVIIIFYNEALSTLLRTVYSVILRSPPQLLKEVILVDDFSDYEELQRPLLKFISQRLPKVRLIRTPRRLGLINARLFGVDAASGITFTFLDSHCECAEGWLEPLLARVSADWRNVAMPVIDVINNENFGYNGLDGKTAPVGGFVWSMDFNWKTLSQRDNALRDSNVAPMRSPTMAGGLFTIHRDFFKDLGYYDPEFNLYGAENLELSFKIWMCGGALEQLPCSHVGHVFRTTTPYLEGKADGLARNKIRLAEVWLDGYKVYFYDLLPKHDADYGDVSQRLEIKKKCHDFEWYLKNVYPERLIPVHHRQFGRVHNAETLQCFEASFGSTHPVEIDNVLTIKMSECKYTPSNQVFAFITDDNTIRCDQYCLGYNDDVINLKRCSIPGAVQGWSFDRNTLVHIDTRRCLDFDNTTLVLHDCTDSPTLRWHWQTEGNPVHQEHAS